MSKKASLKDAFVRNAGAGESAGVERGVPAAQASSDTANPPAVPTAGPPVDVSIQRTVPLYVQPASASAPLLKKKATFNLNAALHQRLKVAAAIHGREMVDIVEEALKLYLPGLDQQSG